MTHLKKAGSEYIPAWDGLLEERERYVVRCVIYVRGTEPHKVPNGTANHIHYIDTSSEPWKLIVNLCEDDRIALQGNLENIPGFPQR